MDERDWSKLWTLDPGVTFLNHGSFGACPAAVLHAQALLRDRMERHPVRFLDRELEGYLDEARAALAAFVGADADDLAFVPNATTGVNTVLRALEFVPGDEILVTDHAYNACRNAVEYVAARAGATVVVAPVPFPLADPAEVTRAVLARVTRFTRLVLVDHVTSPTGIVLPVAEIARGLEGSGIDLLVDGAHAPGMLPLDVDALGAAYYAGNAHKWLCAPKGAAFLWVRRDRQADVRPLTISHGWNAARTDRSRFRLLFDWTGTDDPTPYLCIPESLRFVGSLLPGGWAELRERNRALALEARALLCDALGVAPPAPESMLGSLATVPLPPSEDGSLTGRDPYQRHLLDAYGIEVPVFAWPRPPRRWLRVSAQLYNRRAHYERLAQALREPRHP